MPPRSRETKMPQLRKTAIHFYLAPNGSFRSGQIDRVDVLTDGSERNWEPKTLDPEDLEGVLEGLNADLLAQRDDLLAQVAALTAERDEALGANAPLQAEIDRLNALLNPPANPRHLAPYVFLSLLKPEEIIALQTSVDPIVIVGRAKLQTIITYVDLDHPDTIGLAQYMESQGLFAPGRAAQILAGESPTA